MRAPTVQSSYASGSKMALILMDCRVIPASNAMTPPDTDPQMRSISARAPLALLLALPLLAGCLERGRSPIAESMGDDDQYCQAGGKVAVGSAEYVACRKDRDVQRQNAEARTDRRQRDLGEYMMNHPDVH
jgi:hypothetical protein